MLATGKIIWPVPDEFPLLPAGEIHLWCAWIGRTADEDPAGAGCLSPDEIARAGTFHFAPDRDRFVAARRNLRHVLAGYVAREPASLVFGYGPFGKPALIHQADATGPRDPPASNLTFNQSHGGSLWLLAVAWNQPLGVDVEEVKNLPDLALVESMMFSPRELPPQQSLPLAERRLGFFNRWAGREAAAKFRGVGIEPSAPFVPPDQSELLTPTDGYVGALAYGGAPVRIRRFGWHARLAQPSPLSLSPSRASA